MAVISNNSKHKIYIKQNAECTNLSLEQFHCIDVVSSTHFLYHLLNVELTPHAPINSIYIGFFFQKQKEKLYCFCNTGIVGNIRVLYHLVRDLFYTYAVSF